MACLHISSEIGSLQSVLVHTPGTELHAVTPGTREDYLYDDIIDLETAQREHRQFVAVLSRFAQVRQVRKLLAEVLENPEARNFLITKTMDVIPSDALAQKLGGLPAADIVRMIVEGTEEPSGPIARALNEEGFALPPLPNLFFPRDIGMVVGDHAVIGAMRYGVRWTEELIIKSLFLFHPELANAGLLYDGSDERRVNYTLEGGDVHQLRHDLLVLGFSERTSPAALDQVCELVFARGRITDVVVVVMPRAPTAIHLDMVFTQVDRELCVVFPPHFVGPERLPVLHWHKGESTLREPANIFAALKACGMPMEPIYCGGRHRTTQEREQWASGCNFVALRPGVVLSYQRNESTLHEMEKMGFRNLSGVSFLTGEERIAEGDRAVIAFEGSELVRGGGGPRCMSCPVQREDPWD